MLINVAYFTTLLEFKFLQIRIGIEFFLYRFSLFGAENTANDLTIKFLFLLHSFQYQCHKNLNAQKILALNCFIEKC